MPVDPEEARALAYRAQWRRRLMAQVVRARGLRGSPPAHQALLLRWRPLIMVDRAINVGDANDERSDESGSANG